MPDLSHGLTVDQGGTMMIEYEVIDTLSGDGHIRIDGEIHSYTEAVNALELSRDRAVMHGVDYVHHLG